MTVRAPTRENPQRVPGSDGWVWWRDRHGFPHARNGEVEVTAPSTKFTALLSEIRKAEGGARDGRAGGGR